MMWSKHNHADCCEAGRKDIHWMFPDTEGCPSEVGWAINVSDRGDPCWVNIYYCPFCGEPLPRHVGRDSWNENATEHEDSCQCNAWEFYKCDCRGACSCHWEEGRATARRARRHVDEVQIVGVDFGEDCRRPPVLAGPSRHPHDEAPQRIVGLAASDPNDPSPCSMADLARAFRTETGEELQLQGNLRVEFRPEGVVALVDENGADRALMPRGVYQEFKRRAEEK